MSTLVPTAPVRHGLLFQRLRWRLLRNTLRVLLSRALVRVITILICCLLVWGTLFTLSYVGFTELDRRWQVPLNGPLFQFLLGLMFMSLTILLVFSTGIILYSSLFSAPESAFLLVGPVAADQLFAYKYQGAVAFSSWAFVLLASPVLIAYGLVLGSPWYFYALLPLFFFGFVLLPGSVGALVCLLLVNYLPRRRKQALLLVGLLLTATLGWWVAARLLPPAQSVLHSLDSVNQLLGEFSFVQSPLLPAHWIARGLQSAALDELEDSLYHLALVWSNGLFFYVLTAWAAGRLYRRGFDRMASGGTLRRRYGGAWMDRIVTRVLGFLDPQTQLLIVKDFRTFRRDPAQWAQVLIFLGLAVLYFSNVRRFYEQDLGRRFQNGISMLNLTATSFLLCSYTGRFIYPMLSLEGRKFWILGLLPLERDRLLWGKFAFSATGALLTSEFVVIFSNLMLNMPWQIIVLHVLAVAVVALGLSGLSVGLGAVMPNFRETDPSKIAVGFGGTMNLVAGLLLLVLVIATMALPAHLMIAAHFEEGFVLTKRQTWVVVGGVLFGLTLGIVAVVLPLRAGMRALRGMEF